MRKRPTGKYSRALVSERRQPKQDRAKQTVNAILDTAAKLLEEVGIDSFNTNLLARRAGIRVRSIYRYFPNKLAVIAAIWKKMMLEWDDMLEPGLSDLSDPEKDMAIGWRAIADPYIHWVTDRTGARIVRSTVRALPELRDQEKAAEVWFVNRLARALTKRGVPLPQERLRALSTVLYRSGNAVIHTELANFARPRDRVISEMHRMIIGHLQELPKRTTTDLQLTGNSPAPQSAASTG